MHIASIGIDLSKTTFRLLAPGERNKVLVRKKFSRAQRGWRCAAVRGEDAVPLPWGASGGSGGRNGVHAHPWPVGKMGLCAEPERTLFHVERGV